ncbi:MAG: hypothetical protein ACKV2Q_23220 [Planctomycetaceae bacterium]
MRLRTKGAVASLSGRRSSARQAVQQAFQPDSADAPGDADERVLFWIPVTGRLIQRLVLSLILGCHSSYRGAMALLTEMLGIAISVGTIHNLVCAVAVSARRINEQAELSGVRIGAHDEIFQNGQPVLVGCDVASTYCYLLSLEEHRDADTWRLRLLELGDHGWKPDTTIADGGRGPVSSWRCRGCRVGAMSSTRSVRSAKSRRIWRTWPSARSPPANSGSPPFMLKVVFAVG